MQKRKICVWVNEGTFILTQGNEHNDCIEHSTGNFTEKGKEDHRHNVCGVE